MLMKTADNKWQSDEMHPLLPASGQIAPSLLMNPKHIQPTDIVYTSTSQGKSLPTVKPIVDVLNGPSRLQNPE